MSRGFVARAVLGVLFAAASFAGAIVVHPDERMDAGATLVGDTTELVDSSARSRCRDELARPSRSDERRGTEARATRPMSPRRHCDPVHG